MFWLCSTGRLWWWGSCPLLSLFCPRCRSAANVYMVFQHQSLTVACWKDVLHSWEKRQKECIDALDTGNGRDLLGAGCHFVTLSPIHVLRLSLLSSHFVSKDCWSGATQMPVSVHTSTICLCKPAAWPVPISLPAFFLFSSKEPTSSSWCNSFPLHQVSQMQKFQNCADQSIFFQLTWFFMLQEILEEEAVQAALIQVALERKAVHHGLCCWGGMLRVWNWRLCIAWNWRLFIACHWGCNARLWFQEQSFAWHHRNICPWSENRFQSQSTKSVHQSFSTMFCSSLSGSIDVISPVKIGTNHQHQSWKNAYLWDTIMIWQF